MSPPNEPPRDALPKGMTERPDMIGRVLSDRYRIDALIAGGAFGAVYRGAHLHMHKQVAIKVLHPEIENFPELVERFEREAVAGAHISHPNVAVASDLGKFDGESYFLVQEYVPGETLRQLMDRGPVPVQRAAFIARQIAEGLAAAHSHKIVHRDLKPTNVMIVDGTDDLVKLIDFGFARVPIDTLPQVPAGDVGPDWETSKAGVVFGSVAYMAPDALLGMNNVDERSDLYALGLIFYEMLAGKHPFDVELPAVQLFEQHRKAPPPPLRERNPECDVSPDLEWVIMRLLAKSPDERWQDAAAAAAAIAGATRGFSGFFQANESYRPPPGPPMRSSAGLSEVSEPQLTSATEKREPLVRKGGVGGFVRAHPASVLAFGLVGIAVIVIAVGFAVSGGKDPPTRPSAAAALAASEAMPKASAPPSTPQSAAPPQPVDPQAAFVAKPTPSSWLLMLEANPKALETEAVQKKTISMLLALEPEDEATQQVFDQLTHSRGSAGLDVLYGVLEAAPTSKSGTRAAQVLFRADTVERASPALRVTLDIRRMNCTRKLERFPVAARDGDERTARQLEKLRPPACTIKKGACCFRDDATLERTLAQIRERGN